MKKSIFGLEGGKLLDAIFDEVIKVFENYPDVLFGFSDISYSEEYKSEYAGAFVFAVPHAKMLSIDDYIEEIFESLILQSRDVSDEIIRHLIRVFDANRISYNEPSVSQINEETLIAPFSLKFAAIHAGLGWIGKNGVLVTEKFGPRLRLSALLVNYDFPKSISVFESKCPIECNICVSACTYNSLTGHQWNIESTRSEIIDYRLCNQKRSLYIEAHGRKHSCGVCMVSCPFGL